MIIRSKTKKTPKKFIDVFNPIDDWVKKDIHFTQEEMELNNYFLKRLSDNKSGKIEYIYKENYIELLNEIRDYLNTIETTPEIIIYIKASEKPMDIFLRYFTIIKNK